MQLSITTRHTTKASLSVKQRIIDKLRKHESHFNHITNIQVTIDKQHSLKIAEATLHLDTGGKIFAKASENNLYSAIDSLSNKINRQLQKAKSKIKTRQSDSAKRDCVGLDDKVVA